MKACTVTPTKLVLYFAPSLALLCLLLACHSNQPKPSPSGDSGDSIKFYIVEGQSISGGRYIDTPEFAKLGYVAGTPDLVITRLADFYTNASPTTSTMIDKNGKITIIPEKTYAEFIVTFLPEDAVRFTALTEKAVGKKVLIMLNNRMMIAPRVMVALQSPVASLGRCGDYPDAEDIQNRLKKLVRQ